MRSSRPFLARSINALTGKLQALFKRMVLANANSVPSRGFQKRGIGLQSSVAADRNQPLLKQFQLVAHRDLAHTLIDEQLSCDVLPLPNARGPRESARTGTYFIKPLILCVQDLRMMYDKTVNCVSFMVAAT
jgi:hypothetical protein